MEGLRATCEEESKCLSGCGKPGKESQVSIIPGGWGCHLQGQDADEKLSLGSVEFEKYGGHPSRDFSIWSSGVSWRLRWDSHQPFSDHRGQRGACHAPERGCREKAGRSKKRSLSDFHVYGLVELDQQT